MKPISLILALLVVASVAVIGCSKESSLEGTVPVSGTVKQKGAPVEGASVTFSPVGQGTARAASGKTDASGKFTLTTLKAGDGAMPGEYEVTVTKIETEGKALSEQEAKDYYNKYQKPPPAPKVKNVLPEKYSKAATSGLKATVKKGEKNEFNFDVD